MATGTHNIAIWAVTSNGLTLAARLRHQWPDAAIHCSRRLAPEGLVLEARGFDGLKAAVAKLFRCFDGHIFIMAAGIVMRVAAPLLGQKHRDPAVVVVDDMGRFAISLASGHIGGANRLARGVADSLGAIPVITTATDVNARPAVDLLATAKGLVIENPAAIKGLNMALLRGETFPVHDPHGFMPEICAQGGCAVAASVLEELEENQPGLYVDDGLRPLPPSVLILRPLSLAAGVGCNRGAAAEEIEALLSAALAAAGLSLRSLGRIASLDLKIDEPGLRHLSRVLGVPLHFFTAEELNRVPHVPSPSAMAAKHVGVYSVCEAAAILAAEQGTIIVTKRKSANATVAIARRDWSLSASALAMAPISPAGPDRH